MSNPYGNDPYGQQPPNPYGAGGGSYDAHGAGGFNQAPKTDGVSVAALVLGLLCCGPGGLILGFIGLGRTKGGQRKGRGMAIAGIILGIVGLIANAAIIIGLIAGVGWLGDVRTIEDLEKGQCINADGLKQDESESVGVITEVDCSEDHDGQVVATKTLSSEEADNYDFGDEAQIGEHCGTMLDAELSAKLLTSEYYLLALTESKNPDAGDQVACVVSLASGDDLTEDLL